MDNYQKALVYARELFLGWDQEKIIARSRLQSDEKYIYISFLGLPYRIERSTGLAECTADGSRQAGFSETMSIYDYICRDNPPFVPTGRLSPVNGLRNAARSSPDDTAYHRKWALRFQEHMPALRQAVVEMALAPFPRGDVACMFPVFDGFAAVFQFWAGDEEFPPSVRFLWDENTPDCLKYETTYYVMGCFLNLLDQKIAAIERNCK